MKTKPMPVGYTRKSVPADVGLLAPNLRQADLDEIVAREPTYTASQALQQGYDLSQPCNTMVKNDGTLLGMWGVAPAEPTSTVGVIWMLGTAELTDTPAVARRFLLESRRLLPDLLDVYPVLTNLIDARNVAHIRFIEWLGFEIWPEVYMINGFKFHLFRLTRDDFNKRWSK